MPKLLFSTLFAIGLLLFGNLPRAYAGPCDTVQLETNMIWAYNNNEGARKLIQQGVLEGGTPGAAKIEAGYRQGQSHNGDALKHLNSCGPIELLQTAKKVTGT